MHFIPYLCVNFIFNVWQNWALSNWIRFHKINDRFWNLEFGKFGSSKRHEWLVKTGRHVRIDRIKREQIYLCLTDFESWRSGEVVRLVFKGKMVLHLFEIDFSIWGFRVENNVSCKWSTSTQHWFWSYAHLIKFRCDLLRINIRLFYWFLLSDSMQTLAGFLILLIWNGHTNNLVLFSLGLLARVNGWSFASLRMFGVFIMVV